ncbi:MAG TPA: DNA polymerase III subunit delta [Polyangiaceae bacterium]|nr:DNA polymerase III subunit delta [Polyangiaceae bacterium]
MTPDEAIREAESKQLRPVYLVAGDEAYLGSMVLSALKAAALEGAIPGLNEDSLNAAERTVDDALAAARTLPMMAKRRLVVVHRLERWEPRSSGDEGVKDSKPNKDPFERLLEYAKQPSPSTVLILSGSGIDKRRKLYVTARNEGWLVACETLGRAELPLFVEREAKRLNARLSPGISDLIAELAGPDLGPVADAVNRLSLYAGSEVVTEEMVAECVVRLRPATVWELVAAVGRRDAGSALTALHEVFDPSEAVRLVGLLAWSTRQLIRFESALHHGAAPAEAAQQAGAPPFKARDLAQQVKTVPRETLESWLLTLMGIDRALKGGSKLPQKAILERGILELCAKKPDPSASARRPQDA